VLRRSAKKRPWLTTADRFPWPWLTEPYATMVFVAVFTALRVSEPIGLK
jgi:hypothetical protein